MINWRIPAAVLGSLLLASTLGYLATPDATATPMLHLFSGATMLGAFFIATDPVSASTTAKGRLVYGALIGCWSISSDALAATRTPSPSRCCWPTCACR